MRKYIIFSEDELYDLLNGGETQHIIDEPGEVFFVSEETYADMLKNSNQSNYNEDDEHPWYTEGKNLYLD